MARRNGYDYAIILNDVDLENDAADYVFIPGTISGLTSPKLMVLLREDRGKVKVSILRETFWGGKIEMEFEVTLR